MNFNPIIKETLRAQPISLFSQNSSAESLIEDIKSVCSDLLLNVNTLSKQKERVLALDEMIKFTINTFRAQSKTYESFEILKNFQSFILIINRTLENFDLEVQITIGEKTCKFSLRN